VKYDPSEVEPPRAVAVEAEPGGRLELRRGVAARARNSRTWFVLTADEGRSHGRVVAGRAEPGLVFEPGSQV